MKKIVMVCLVVSVNLYAMEITKLEMRANLAYRAAWTAAIEGCRRYDAVLPKNTSPSLQDQERAFFAFESYFSQLPPELYEKLSLIIARDVGRVDILANHMLFLEEQGQKDQSLHFFSTIHASAQEDIIKSFINLENDLVLQFITMLTSDQLSNYAFFIRDKCKETEYTKKIRAAIGTLLKTLYKTDSAHPNHSFADHIVDQTNILLSTYGLPSEDSYLELASSFFYTLPHADRPLFIEYLLMGYGCATGKQAVQACNIFFKIMAESPDTTIEHSSHLLHLMKLFTERYPDTLARFDSYAQYIDARCRVLFELAHLTAECQSRILIDLLVEACQSKDSAAARAKVEEAKQVVIPEAIKKIVLEMLLQWDHDSQLLSSLKKNNFAGLYLNYLIEILLPHFLGDDFVFFLQVMAWHKQMQVQESVVQMLHTHLNLLTPAQEIDEYKLKIVEYLYMLKNEIQSDALDSQNSNA